MGLSFASTAVLLLLLVTVGMSLITAIVFAITLVIAVLMRYCDFDRGFVIASCHSSISQNLVKFRLIRVIKSEYIIGDLALISFIDVGFLSSWQGKLTDGTVFDSSFERGDPIEFELGGGQVIKGWDQGLLGMCVGEKRKLKIPAKLGYGAQGSPPTIPGNIYSRFLVV
ncbi:hypothetical protein RJ639_039742 [Escallonia herrerae]|uniref:peptidylprolyl isomerase n=1 Tax=Escallonia herrerae TaxID=1293975 RepID=A0AA89B7J2_9ASTE|nr:hypothetical protein RJ639_039742 [Escallonia herrerae]